MTAAALKIALVNTFYPPWNFGGDGVYVRRFAHALARRGCEVHVVHDTETYELLAAETRGALQPLDEPDGVVVHRLRSGFGLAAGLATHQTGRPLFNARRLKSLLQGFDVTHFHNVSMAGGPGALSYGSGVRLYTAHEHWLVCPTHILWRHQREVCDRRECLKCQIAHKRPPQLWRMTGYLERQSAKIDAFIALSQSSADNHRRFGFARKMHVLPSFLPDEAAPPTPAPGGRPYVLFVGRLEAIKGLQDIVPLFLDDPPADLVVVGDGDYAPTLKSLAGDSPHVRFLGRLPPENLSALYAGATAVATPSVCLEVFPLVAIEAFRAGAPIIARNLGPFPEIVEASGAGLLFTTPDEARAAIARLAGDRALRAELGAKARRAFESRWSEAVALDAYLDLIAETADAKGLSGVADKARSLTRARAISRTGSPDCSSSCS